MYITFYIKAPHLHTHHWNLEAKCPGGGWGAKRPVWAKSPGAKQPETKRPGGETFMGGNGFGMKRPGTNVTGAMNCPISTWLP